MSTPESGNSHPVCGVVVIFHPESAFVQTLRTLVEECGRVVVVNNGSDAGLCARITEVPGVEVLTLSSNLGVAAALNRGAARARELGFARMVAFDQDSRPRAGMVRSLLATQKRFPHAAVVGPRIEDAVPGSRPYRWVRRHRRWPGLFERVDSTGGDLAEVTMMVTSGSMVDLAVWASLDGFDESLFIDYVDTEYCLRVIRSGRMVAVSAEAVLEHRLGERRSQQVLGHDFRPTHHAAFRHYFMARNRIAVWKRHAFARPHWALFDAGFTAYNGFRVLAFEPDRWRKLKAMFLGTCDGLRGCSGPFPTQRGNLIDPPKNRGPA